MREGERMSGRVWESYGMRGWEYEWESECVRIWYLVLEGERDRETKKV